MVRKRRTPKTYEAGLIMDKLQREHGHQWRELPDDHPEMVKLRELLNFKIEVTPGPENYQVGIYNYNDLVEVVDSVHVIAKRINKSPATIKNHCYKTLDDRSEIPVSYKFIKERGIYENGKLSK